MSCLFSPILVPFCSALAAAAAVLQIRLLPLPFQCLAALVAADYPLRS